MTLQADTDKKPEDIQSSPPASSETSSKYDDTYEAYKRNQDTQIDAVEAKKVLRKIDIRIVPILFFIYLLQYLDKNGINYASAYGLSEGTKLKGQDFSWLGTETRILDKAKLNPVKGQFSTLVILPVNTQADTFFSVYL